MTDSENKQDNLLPCPFCGCDAGIRWTDNNMQSVGCVALSMLCPNPSVTVYKHDGVNFDYAPWNERKIL